MAIGFPVMASFPSGLYRMKMSLPPVNHHEIVIPILFVSLVVRPMGVLVRLDAQERISERNPVIYAPLVHTVAVNRPQGGIVDEIVVCPSIPNVEAVSNLHLFRVREEGSPTRVVREIKHETPHAMEPPVDVVTL